MQALLSYLDSASIPAAARPNVSGQPVRSLTLGMVNQRQAGYGISAATTHDQLRLLQLLVTLTHDPYIAGGGPQVTEAGQKEAGRAAEDVEGGGGREGLGF